MERKSKQELEYTKYEIARILGARALQISANAPILLKISKEELESLNYDPIKIAELEFNAGILPITIKRPFPKYSEPKHEPIKEIVKEEEEQPAEKLKESSKDKTEELESVAGAELKEDFSEEESSEEKSDEE